jgi:hypothetical protein
VYYTNSSYTTVLRVSTNTSGTNTTADKAVMKPGARGYRLPTEAEWEYAARGGGTPSTSGSFADKWAGTDTESELGDYAWYRNNSYSLGNGDPDYGIHAVGGKTANSLGLYDMSGNVSEWCWDWYSSPIAGGMVTDPTGPTSGSFQRVVRGAIGVERRPTVRLPSGTTALPSFGSRSLGSGWRPAPESRKSVSLWLSEPRCGTKPFSAVSLRAAKLSNAFMPLPGL